MIGFQRKVDIDNFFVSWSDLITLLLVLFAYIVSISTVDSVKLKIASQSMSSELNGEQRQLVLTQDLTALKDVINEEIVLNKLKDKVVIDQFDNKLFIEIKQDLLFLEGSAKLMPMSNGILKMLADSFMKKSYFISIEGHTDNIPIHTNDFSDNWVLSSVRAVNVLNVLKNYGVQGRSMRAIGYADTQPLVPNNNNENRKINRRVTFVVESFNQRDL